jgi:ABC-type Mn2+/Zn2+ transport system permease subunit
VAGVLLVFSYLIVPALAGIMLGGRTSARLATGWIFGTAVSVVGIAASAVLDLPTGATVVCAFGLMLLALAVVQLLRGGRVVASARQMLGSGARR